MDVSYRLKFIVDPSGIAFDLKVEMPIMIGNIPLRVYFQQIAQLRPNQPPPNIIDWPTDQQKAEASEKFNENSATSQAFQSYLSNQPGIIHTLQTPSAPPVPPTAYDDLPPPSYAEAVGAYEDGRPNQLRSERDNENTDANWDFNPRYPVWSVPNISSQ